MQVEAKYPEQPVVPPESVVITLSVSEAKSLKWALLDIKSRGNSSVTKWFDSVWNDIVAAHSALEAVVPGET